MRTPELGGTNVSIIADILLPFLTPGDTVVDRPYRNGRVATVHR
jgi:hypothetical protein